MTLLISINEKLSLQNNAVALLIKKQHRQIDV